MDSVRGSVRVEVDRGFESNGLDEIDLEESSMNEEERVLLLPLVHEYLLSSQLRLTAHTFSQEVCYYSIVHLSIISPHLFFSLSSSFFLHLYV